MAVARPWAWWIARLAVAGGGCAARMEDTSGEKEATATEWTFVDLWDLYQGAVSWPNPYGVAIEISG